MMRLTVAGMMTRRLSARIINIVSRSVKMAQLELARRMARASASWVCQPDWRGQPVAPPLTINICCGISTATRSATARGLQLLQSNGKTFEELWRAARRGQSAKRCGPPGESAPIAAFLCRNMAASSPARIWLIDGGAIRDVLRGFVGWLAPKRDVTHRWRLW